MIRKTKYILANVMILIATLYIMGVFSFGVMSTWDGYKESFLFYIVFFGGNVYLLGAPSYWLEKIIEPNYGEPEDGEDTE